MRKFITFIIILALLVFGIPYGMGFIAKKQFNTFIITLNNAPNVTVKVDHYKQGIFSSDANMSLQIQLAKGHNAQKTIDINTTAHIMHGPIFRLAKKWHFAEAGITLAANFQPSADFTLEQPAAVLNTVVLFNGSLLENIHIFKIAYKDPKSGVSLSTDGLNLQVKFGNNPTSYVGTLTVDNTQMLADKEVQYTVAPINVTFNFQKTKDGLWTGSKTLSLPSITKTDGQTTIPVLNKLVIAGAMTDDDKTMSGNINASLQQINIDDQSYGPISFHYSLNQLDRQNLVNLVNDMQQASQRSPNIVKIIMQDIPSLVRQNSTSVLTLNATLPGNQQIIVNGNLQFNALSQTNAQTIPQVVKATNLVMHLQAPKLWLDNLIAGQKQSTSAPQQLTAKDYLDNALATGQVELVDGNYQTDITFNNGKFLLNGKPFTRPQPPQPSQTIIPNMTTTSPLPKAKLPLMGPGPVIIPQQTGPLLQGNQPTEAAPAASATTTDTTQ